MFRTFLIASLTLFPLTGTATELAVGLQSTFSQIEIQDPANEDKELAVMTSDYQLFPTVSLISDPYYFSDDTNFGVQFQVDWSYFKADQQALKNSASSVDLGTSIKAYAITAVPVVFYQFNRHAAKDWNIKLGAGLGMGYLDLTGNYRITNTEAESGEIRKVNKNGLGMAINIYLEGNVGNHMLLLYNFSPILSDQTNDFQEHNVVVAYKYRFSLDHLWSAE
ncbi:hypothetical protein [Photobacterium galatheae]|uniref:Outer membrane protein beta-barrel domain-containing protein n=1 Tax=Photobacterium galatheae TaxID=1654360 RepID=A0A066RQB5_9GAMM|nr:hypothetical protein [Photobacterium galatheae]KDM89877.1 hypothetical protein EA58_20725 [Photobacterium galatheae]MCM0151171.1 hypothetical protein [Photobacterium galatheae]